MQNLKHLRACLCIVLCCIVAMQYTPVAEDLADETRPSPVVWRFPLESGPGTGMYIVDGNLLVYQPGGRVRFLDLDGNQLDQWNDELEYELDLEIEGSCGADSRWVGNQVLSIINLADPNQPYSNESQNYILRFSDYKNNTIAEQPIANQGYGLRNLKFSGDYLIIGVDPQGYLAPQEGRTALIVNRLGEVLGKFTLHPSSDYLQSSLKPSFLIQENSITYSDGEGIHCISEDGKLKWEHKNVDLAYAKLYEYEDGDICAYGYYAGFLTRFSAIGELQWQTKLGLMDISNRDQIPAHAMDSQGRFYWVGSGVLTAIDPDGHIAWKRIRITSSEIRVGTMDNIYLWDSGTLASLDPEGNFLWRETSLADPKGLIITGPNGCLFVVNGNELYCLDPTSYSQQRDAPDSGVVKHFQRGHVDRARFSFPITYKEFLYHSDNWVDKVEFNSTGKLFIAARFSGTIELSKDGSLEHAYPLNKYYYNILFGDQAVASLMFDLGKHPRNEFIEDYTYNSTGDGYVFPRSRPFKPQEIFVVGRDPTTTWHHEFSQDTMISGFSSSDNYIYVFGDKIWRFTWSGAFCGVIDHGRFYTGALELPNGQLVLSYDWPTVGFEVLDSSYSTLAEQDIGDGFRGFSIVPKGESALIVHWGYDSLVAYDVSGKLLWEIEESQLAELGEVTPWRLSVIADSVGNLIIKSNANNLVSIDPDGEIKWFYQCEGDVSGQVIGTDGKFYFSRLNDGVTCLNSNGEVEWEENGIGFVNSAPSIGPDGLVYVRTYEGVVALEP